MVVASFGVMPAEAVPFETMLFETASLETVSLETYGRYQLIKKIAVGGMGEVWLARDTVLDRDVPDRPDRG